jgi:hypothetical protein
MDHQEEFDRLKSRLRWESGGPLAHLADQTANVVASGAGGFVVWLQKRVEERPLVSIIFAFQLGFAAGRWGPRRAQH